MCFALVFCVGGFSAALFLFVIVSMLPLSKTTTKMSGGDQGEGLRLRQFPSLSRERVSMVVIQRSVAVATEARLRVAVQRLHRKIPIAYRVRADVHFSSMRLTKKEKELLQKVMRRIASAGGTARALNLTPEQRSASAKIANAARIAKRVAARAAQESTSPRLKSA
jgi:hypothetical protein